MSKVYIVEGSNGEPYEDYISETLGVFTTLEKAVAYIENEQKLIKKRDNYWSQEFPVYPRREDCDSEEEWAYYHEEDGSLSPIYVEYADAWINEMELL